MRRHFAAFHGLDIRPVLESPRREGYRHKVQLPFAREGASVSLGCYEAGSHRVVDQSECLVQEPGLSRAAWAVRDWAREQGVSIYDEGSGEGWLRHLLLRRGASTGEVLLGLVTNGPGSAPAPLLEDLLARVRGALASDDDGSLLVGLVQNLNSARTNVVLGHEQRLLWGRAFLKERLGPFTFPVGLSTFYQVNPFQTPRLYDFAVGALPMGGRILDLYCGIGSISLWAAQRASEVVGVEENPASVEAAQRAATDNGIANATFIAGDAGRVMADLAAEAARPGGRRFAGALVDPPRKGLEPSVREALGRLGLKRLVYVSCYPATLARDAKEMTGRFKLIGIQPVDMFPHTRHVECVATFDAV